MEKTRRRQRRPARSAEEWKQSVDAWHRSGLTGKGYAEQHGIAVENLYKWATRLGVAKRGSGPDRAKERARQFVAVQVAEPPPPATQSTLTGAGVEVEWPSGVVVRLPGQVSQETLTMLLRTVMEGTPC